MKIVRGAAIAALFLGVSSLFAADAGIALVGRGLVPGDSLDQSGLAGKKICQRDDHTVCIDQATFGGFGSAITYTGHNNVFLVVPDRGPFDGRTDVPNLDRFHFLYMKVDPSKPFPNITTKLLDTAFLKNEAGKTFVGDAYAFNEVNPLAALRFDPEGVRIGLLGTFFISDEYGPYINEFGWGGHLLRRIKVPSKFLIDNPTGDIDSAGNSFELYPTTSTPPVSGGGNDSGRQANRGMEGLAITPDGRYLVGIMQNALIQDNGLTTSVPPGRKGLNSRILKIDLLTGKTKEFVYAIDAIGSGRGVNEMIAINDHEFLVLERDNRTNVPTPPNSVQAPQEKRIYKIDLNKPGLTDVSSVASLPTDATGFKDFFGAGKDLVAVTKALFIDMLDPDYKVDATHAIKDVIAEKLEGLAWGPGLADGRQVLYVMSDNDLFPGLPTQIYAFAVDTKAAGVKYQPQFLPVPLYPVSQLIQRALDDR